MSDTKHTDIKLPVSSKYRGVEYPVRLWDDKGMFVCMAAPEHISVIKNALNTHYGLLEALESAIHIIELQYDWEMITAEDGETYETFSGLRKDMPTYMRELDSTTGTTPKEIDETLRELKSALATARA